jgi:hypothetical protein
MLLSITAFSILPLALVAISDQTYQAKADSQNSVEFKVTDNSGRWFDTGIDIAGSRSLAVASDKDGIIGEGEKLVIDANTLSLGPHTVTLKATDSDGAVSQVNTDIFVGTEQVTTSYFIATINGANEVDPTPSTTTGSGVFSYNNTTNELTYNIPFSGLSSAETGAHIHQGAVGLEGPILFTLPSGSPKTGTVTLSDSQETLLLSGGLYVNIHSTNFPGGEIRGQIIAIDACAPTANDWTITSSCILASNFTAPANVIVQNNSVLVIPSGKTLDINFATNHLIIKSGSGVLIQSGGKIF